MAELLACPFCRQMFTRGEATQCPDCGIALRPMHELGPSLEAQAIDPEPPVPAEYELLPWTFLGLGRGLLLLVSCVGMALLFAPWLRESAPEIRQWSGFVFARNLPWLWAAPVAWFITFAVVASRRTAYHMRGARLAVALLATMALATTVLRIALRPQAESWVPRRYEWGWGLYASAAVAVVGILLSLRFGGRREPEPPPGGSSRVPDEPAADRSGGATP